MAHSTPIASNAKPQSGSYPDAFTLHPAPRAFIGQHVLACIGAVMVLQPHWLYQLTGLRFPESAQAGALVLGAVILAGAILALVSVTRFLWSFSANSYLIDRNGVEQVQWYFAGLRLRRRSPRVNFSHLRAVDVEQTLTQMLLGVGAVRLASGGTDNYEIDLRNVSRPRALRAEFQRRIQSQPAARIVRPTGESP